MREQHNPSGARRNAQTAFQLNRVRRDADDLFACLNDFIVALLLAGAGARYGYENRIMSGVRIDKWLWAARFFKTRTLAAKACELGRIQYRGQPAKAARQVTIGDLLSVKNESGEFQVEVLALSEVRGPAAMAQTLYRETETSRELRLKAAEQRKLMPHFETSRSGRPSKRDRRELARLRGRV